MTSRRTIESAPAREILHFPHGSEAEKLLTTWHKDDPDLPLRRFLQHQTNKKNTAVSENENDSILFCFTTVPLFARDGYKSITKNPLISQRILAPQIGLEPITLRLTAECSAIELLRQILNPATTYSPGPLPAKYHQRAEA